MQKIDKLDCELYKYYNYIFEFIFSVLHEIFIQDGRKLTTELLYSQIFMFLELKWYPKNTFLNNDCPNAILVKAFIDYSCLISRVVLGHRCSEQNDLKLDNQRLLIYTNLLIFYFKEEKHFC